MGRAQCPAMKHLLLPLPLPAAAGLHRSLLALLLRHSLRAASPRQKRRRTR